MTSQDLSVHEQGGPSVRRAALMFLAPALLLILATFFLPAVASLVLSVTDFDLYAVASGANLRVVGLQNYGALVHDPLFWTALRNTLYYVLVGGPLSVAVSLGVALLLDSRLVRFKAFFRTVFFAPVVTTLVAVAVIFNYLYAPRVGLLNIGLRCVGTAVH